MKKRIAMFDIINIFLFTLICLVCFIPFYQVVVTSFVSFKEYISKDGLIFLPIQWTLQAYEFVFKTNTFTKSVLNSVVITVVGTLISMLLTVMMAYPMSKPKLRGARFFSFLIILPMMLSGGLIPFFLVVRSLKLINTLWSLILPFCLSTFNVILMKNYLYTIPESLEESAKLEGANDLKILFRIVLPLCLPVIATLTLFYGVSYWNDYFRAILFITKSNLYPIQTLLRQILVDNSLDSLGQGMNWLTAKSFETSHTIKMAIVVVATVPILCVYPFLQKYYVKGIMMGAVKG